MLKVGVRLRSQVCTTEIIVVKAEKEVALNCGGFPMVDLTHPQSSELALAEDFTQGSLIGKRYTDDAGTVEILVTKPGKGTLALDATPLQLKAAKPLPASD
ncbi:hypothetical protein [Nocardia salmonicida]|uniref:hypothetical protein n=1 Tax=Nocardia salmonicida TaxID=53431 RepID=UPI00341140D7